MVAGCLYPDDLGALLVQLCCILLVCLLLASFELLTVVFLQLAVVAAVCVFTEGAVAHDVYPEVACVEITSGPLVGCHIGIVSDYRGTNMIK